MEQLLTIKGLKIAGLEEDRWKPIVKGIDLTLNRGEVIGLIGESGAGKSTIGLSTMGYTRPGCKITGGSILFKGEEMIGASKDRLRSIRGNRIAYVAQSAAESFNPAHNLLKQFSEAPTKHGVMPLADARKKAVELYERLQLPEPETIGNRYPHQVSGGQLQRAMVAMAMSCNPDMIIYDEPTTALDVTTQIEVLAAIKEATRLLNTAAIYITHDLAVVAQIADRIMVLRYGETVEEGPTRELLEHPKETYTSELLSVRSLREVKEAQGRQNEVILEVKNVTAGYVAGTDILKKIDLKVRRGRTVAVVGESGSGKSTLARVITGLLPPAEGSIRFGDVTLAPAMKNRSKESLRRLQMIYQMADTALNPRQKVKKILGRPLEFYFGMNGKKKNHRISELLDMIELTDKYRDRYPSELSGGEKQRVCIARALAAKPELIICDEVTSALDQLVAEEILKLLERLQEKLDVSYLFITHDLATVKKIADRIVVMLQGEIVEQGEKEQVLVPPFHDYTQLLLSSVPEMDPDWLDKLLKSRGQVFEMNV